jgi:hypothetical protein
MLETGQDQSGGVMPMVLCRSHGGPYDDDAFLSGWRLGEIGAMLAERRISALAMSIRPAERLQADLLAMACGYSMIVEPGGSRDWLSVTFARSRDDI